MATSAIGGGCHSAVVHAGGRNPAGRFMAGAAGGVRFDVVGGLATCRGAVVAAGTTGRGNPQVIKFGAGKRYCGVAGVACLLSNKVLGGPHYIRRS